MTEFSSTSGELTICRIDLIWHLRKTFGTAIDVRKEIRILTVVICTRSVRCEDIDLERL